MFILKASAGIVESLAFQCVSSRVNDTDTYTLTYTHILTHSNNIHQKHITKQTDTRTHSDLAHTSGPYWTQQTLQHSYTIHT